ncbi:MAG: hypothetical protein PHV36_11040 [Elusimicrobiales bacterium]|nr:hypothetical protein [Elusimicrobiales bacterium]
MGRCETEKRAWGSPVPGGYNVWGWISAFTDEDQGTWEDLDRAKQDSTIEKAGAACKKADERLAATNAQTNGKAILSLSGRDLEYIGVCLKDGEAVSEALSAKRAKLAEIQAKVSNGAYDEADMQWLRANGITLEQRAPAGLQTSKQKEERAQKQEKTTAAARKKYGKMKDMNADGLAGVYDGAASGKNGANAGSSAVDLSAKKSAMGTLKLETRGPQKELTSMAPPQIGESGGHGMKTAAPAKAEPKMEVQKASSAYDYKLSKIGSSKALSAAQDQAQTEKLAREAQVGVAIATREEHEKITKAFINHSGIGGVIPVVYDFAPGGVAADCVSGKCTDGSGAWGKVVQIVTGTKSKREAGGGYYTRTETACAGLADIAGDLDALTFGLTKRIPLPSACNRPNGSK